MGVLNYAKAIAAFNSGLRHLDDVSQVTGANALLPVPPRPFVPSSKACSKQFIAPNYVNQCN